ncbi:MAG: lysophospholipid acyltransferase family protein, partial [Vicinamibacteria bacterium]
MLERLKESARDWVTWKDAEVDRRLERLAHEQNEFGFDPWGFSIDYARRVLTVTSWFYRRYFRVESTGLPNIPPRGRVILIGNHSSQFAIDGMMVATALFLEAEPPRAVKAMIERFFSGIPFWGEFMSRTGQVTGEPGNCVKLLEAENAVLIFPEGARGGGKTIFERYRLQPFGSGFMRIALATGAPIVPFAFVGGEEMLPSLSRMKPLARLIGAPYFPLVPTLLPVPLPVKCHLEFGKALRFDGDPNDEDEAIDEKVAQVRAAVMRLVKRGLKR